ncbi:MAG: hypothetical protein H0T53_10835 [Herpetosiphonaceae bacterium]|nr:hypothetical protein [Herpetosiphonaceae bacterium]
MNHWFNWPDDIDPPTKFEDICGFFLPLLGLLFDPIVFHVRLDFFLGADYTGLFEAYRVGGYLALGGSLLVYAIIMLRPPHVPGLRTLAAGMLWGCALIAYGFGLALGPFSLVGILFVGLGLLGIIPFLAGVAYHRVGLRLMRGGLPRWYRRWQFWLGLLLMLVGPLGAQLETTRRLDTATQQLIAGQPSERGAAITALRSAFWCSLACYDPLVWAYAREVDATHKLDLASAYQEITGQSIDIRLAQISSS